jgi:hypothetical protein
VGCAAKPDQPESAEAHQENAPGQAKHAHGNHMGVLRATRWSALRRPTRLAYSPTGTGAHATQHTCNAQCTMVLNPAFIAQSCLHRCTPQQVSTGHLQVESAADATTPARATHAPTVIHTCCHLLLPNQRRVHAYGACSQIGLDIQYCMSHFKAVRHRHPKSTLRTCACCERKAV